jgi:hypothetical protein
MKGRNREFMIELLSALKYGLLDDYMDFIPFIKSIANEKRMEIIILLLDGSKSFQYLLTNTNLQKTALSNHLTQLIDIKVISKPTFGSYQLQPDGINFLRNFYNFWKNSGVYQAKRLQKEETRQFSTNFLSDFFHTK